MLDHKALHPVIAVHQRLIGVGLQRGFLAATRGKIGRDHQLGFRVIDPVGQSVGRKAREHDRMNGPNPGASQHRIGGLGDHRQIDHHAVAALYAMRLQHIGHAAGVFQKLGIGDVQGGRGRAVRLPDDRGLVGARHHVTVNAIGRHVQRAIFIPLDRHLADVKAGVLDLGVILDPIDALALLGPECRRIRDRGRIHRCVAFSGHMRLRDELFRRRIHTRCLTDFCHWILLQFEQHDLAIHTARAKNADLPGKCDHNGSVKEVLTLIAIWVFL